MAARHVAAALKGLVRIPKSARMTTRRALALAIACAIALGACGDGGGRPARQPTPIDPASTGALQVEVRVDGTPPAMKPLNMSSVAECAAAHPGPVPAGDALVADGKVQNAFVWLKDGLGDRVFAVPTTPVVMDQQGCLYVPRVIGAQVGQPIEFRNSDAMLHNVRGTPEHASGWNLSLARKGSDRTITVDAPEVAISVRCDVHPWMQGWVGVVDHPFFGVTGSDGRVALGGIPEGRYTVGVWHERFGTRDAPVEITRGGRAELAVTLSAAKPN